MRCPSVSGDNKPKFIRQIKKKKGLFNRNNESDLFKQNLKYLKQLWSIVP